ncbi:MAG TPA: endonuclease/exonuclease/phosphatase family protein [Polyangiaceae bacterium]|nr:endonuclease/exonuclease/phosphatase family protein [Polyangiaceae bacterium]
MRRARLTWGAALAVLALGWGFGRPLIAGSPGTAALAASVSGTDTARGPKSAPAGAETAFTSPAACAALLAGRQRLSRAPGKARFASWNLHWFPDGDSQQRDPGIDVPWMACALAWLDADVVAIQEVKQTPKAVRALATLLSELNRLSGARYVARLDDCGSSVPQHVGLMWNEARVTATDVQTVAALNPHGSACEKQLRPGLAARFRFPSGLDLGAVSAHFKSQADSRALLLRRASFAAVPSVARALSDAARDPDFLLLGDLNTMGCDECEPPISAAEELTAVQRLLGSGVRLVPADATGTERYRGNFTLLDHALGSTAMRELAPGSRTHVAGICAADAPALTKRAADKVGRELSDHCPIVLDLTDQDLD